MNYFILHETLYLNSNYAFRELLYQTVHVSVLAFPLLQLFFENNKWHARSTEPQRHGHTRTKWALIYLSHVCINVCVRTLVLFDLSTSILFHQLFFVIFVFVLLFADICAFGGRCLALQTNAAYILEHDCYTYSHGTKCFCVRWLPFSNFYPRESGDYCLLRDISNWLQGTNDSVINIAEQTLPTRPTVVWLKIMWNSVFFHATLNASSMIHPMR